MKLGYLAVDQYGEKLSLTGLNHPRKQLLDKLGKRNASKMYCDTKSGETKHRGYIVAGRWFNLYEVHEFNP